MRARIEVGVESGVMLWHNYFDNSRGVPDGLKDVCCAHVFPLSLRIVVTVMKLTGNMIG